MMRAEILAIGDELTTGQRVDTNSAWLSDRLTALGIVTGFHTTVGDDRADNVAAFRIAVDRSDVAISTGGLGPTADDLTREVVAELAGVPLVEDAATLAHLLAVFAPRGRPMPDRNRVQAMFPAGTRIVNNPVGTAPGIDLDVRRAGGGTCRVICLPGVPAELKRMWDETVLPRLTAALPAGTRPLFHHRLKLFGLAESDVEQTLPDLIARGRDPLVGITVHQATITLRLTTRGVDRAAALAAMGPTIAEVRAGLGEFVFGEEDDEIEDAAVRGLAGRSLRLATVEVGGAGVLTALLRRADHGGAVYAGGLTVPTVADLPPAWRPPGEEARPEALAESVRQAFGVDVGLVLALPPEALTVESITTGGRGTATVADGRGTAESRFGLFGTRDLMAARSAKLALDLARRRLGATP